jgi:Predicted outer membrane protein
MNKKTKKAYALATICAILLTFATIINPVEAASTGSLTIRKFDVSSYANLSESNGNDSDQANIPADATKASGVEFKVSKLLVGSGNVNVTPTTPVDNSFTPKIGVTNSDGEVVFNNLEQGYYLVSESMRADYDSPEDGKFVVAIPTQVREGNDEVFEYDVVVYPKNKKIQVEKTLESNRQVIGIGDIVPWKVKYPISSGLRKEEIIGGTPRVSYGKNFYITDEMDTRLDYVDGSVKMNYYNEAGTKLNLTLVEGVDYILNYDISTHTLRVSFTDNVGTKKVADVKVATIELMLDTAVNASAIDTMQPMTNNARIKFTNTSGDPFEHEVFPEGASLEDSRVPKVYLGTINIEKVDSQDENIKLAGATFGLAKTANQARSGDFIKRASNNGIGEEPIIVMTDKNGKVSIAAIGEGTYYLRETIAPMGYELTTEPIEVTVANDASKRITNITIKNTFVGEGQDPPVDPTPTITPTDPPNATLTPTSPPNQTPTTIPYSSGGGNTGGGYTGGTTTMSAKTGDTTQILGYVLLAVASVGIVGVIVKKRKRSS